MRLAVLLSGGIDSPVAAYVMARAGAEIVLLHMDNRPYADDDSVDQVRRLADRLREVTGQGMPLYLAPHHLSQTAIGEVCDRSYRCVMCKRTMQRTAKAFALAHDCRGIVMGDSLGQVASQTLRNIWSENAGLDFPVLRPLIGYDKIEIEDIAREIGTYELSIEDVSGCRLVPPDPVTAADPGRIAGFDLGLDLDALAEKVACGARPV
jgi:thiamine biosynthesis protein ThiI